MTFHRVVAAAPGRIFLLALTLAGAGCAGSLFQSKAAAPTTYLLSVKLRADPARAGDAAPLAANLAVQRPRVRTGLESDRIAVLYPDRRLDYFADARWSGPLDLVVEDLAVQAFDGGSHLRAISGEASAFPSGYWLEIHVVDFQAEYATALAAPTVHVRLAVRLGASGDRHVLATFEAEALQRAADNRLSDIVAAFEQGVDAALGKIVADTTSALAAGSEQR
jgi:ABC-type uncharacterized transport system auxiliary subunit